MTFVETQDRYATAGRATAARRPAIEMRDVVKTFGRVVAVDGVSLSVRPGEIVALLGPNGAGKTTTIDMLLGLSRPTRGTVSVYGMSPRAAVARGLVSAVMQTGGLLKDYTVAETVRLTASLFASGRPVAELLDRAGIAAIADRRVGACSGGQQQRLRFAMALAPSPDLLILDEPTTGMDVEGRRDFWAAIRTDAAAGRTVIFATHYLAEADEYADRVVLVRRGQLVADGTPAEIKNLGTGRTVRATLPGASARDLTGIPGAGPVEVRGETVIVQAHDSDTVARYLLTATAARDLQITSRNIEDAFIALTNDDPEENGR
jgi:ABC-2 type transport system ATP-binding protein